MSSEININNELAKLILESCLLDKNKKLIEDKQLISLVFEWLHEVCNFEISLNKSSRLLITYPDARSNKINLEWDLDEILLKFIDEHDFTRDECSYQITKFTKYIEVLQKKLNECEDETYVSADYFCDLVNKKSKAVKPYFNETFKITSDHLKLLQQMSVGYDTCTGYNPVPEINPKRPYGDSCMYHSMGRILDIKPKNGMEFSESQLSHFDNLQEQTAVALSICMARQKFEEGFYGRVGYGNDWKKIL